MCDVDAQVSSPASVQVSGVHCQARSLHSLRLADLSYRVGTSGRQKQHLATFLMRLLKSGFCGTKLKGLNRSVDPIFLHCHVKLDAVH